MVTERRKRVLPNFVKTGKRRFEQGIGFSYHRVDNYLTNFSYVSDETTLSQNHPLYLAKLRVLRDNNPLINKSVMSMIRYKDLGGPFDSVKHGYWMSHPDIYAINTTATTRDEYWGPYGPYTIGAVPTSFTWPVVPAVNELNLIQLGTTAIKRTIPTNPTSGLATALGELRADGISAMPGKAAYRSALNDFRGISPAVGSEFLNVTFGWLPLISDVRKTVKAFTRSKTLIEEFARDSGRLINRRYDFPITTVIGPETVLSTGSTVRPLPGLPNSYFSNQVGTLTKQTTTETKTWFSGAYTYYFNPGDSFLDKVKRQEQTAHKLFGLRINPEVLWELMPWSWAVDWVTNTGDVIANISALSTDSLVLRWGYIMQQVCITDTYTCNGPVFKSGPSGPFVQKFSTTSKVRRKATPYGFGLNFDGFTTRQLAIIAALGITKG